MGICFHYSNFRLTRASSRILTLPLCLPGALVYNGKGTNMRSLNPAQILIIGFLSFILIGTGLLLLPVSTVNGISPEDALFTSTSAVCVTGLIVKDTPNDFTFFGKMVILFLIQAGGLGYMTSATIISLLIGKRIGISERILMQEALNVLTMEGIVKFTKAILLMTILIESAGALILTARFLRDFPAADAVFFGVFHAVSAFNNAGFSLFSDNLISYRADITVNLTISFLIMAGGIGFIVISDVHSYWRKKVFRVSLHTKTVLVTTSALIVSGALLFFLFEYTNESSISGLSLQEQALASYFSSVTARTAGFNTVDYSQLRFETLFIAMLLMFIGASPGSTGGGIKTTTFAIVIASLCSIMRGARDTVLFRKRIPTSTTAKAFLSITFAVLLIVVVTVAVLKLEDIKYLPAVFEVTSAFGTVGLSVGDGGARSLSALFTPLGKILISFTMFAGRLGPLTLAIAVARKSEERFRYPEGKVIIG